MSTVIAPPLAMTDEQRAALEVIARSTTLRTSQGGSGEGVAVGRRWGRHQRSGPAVHTSNESVRAWRRRFETEGVEGVGQHCSGPGPEVRGYPREPWPGRRARHADGTPDDGSTHWTTRLMADRFGIGKDSVARIWRDHNLKPWKVDTFKVSNDPHFEAKLVDVVGLYLNPPERAVVFSFDEKTQVQALDRTQPSLPMKKGRAGR